MERIFVLILLLSLLMLSVLKLLLLMLLLLMLLLLQLFMFVNEEVFDADTTCGLSTLYRARIVFEKRWGTLKMYETMFEIVVFRVT